MIAVIFEVQITDGQADNYFDLAALLKPQLEKVEGFISVERFQSLADQTKFLSLSFWRDEDAVQQWRNLAMHRNAQAAGRDHIFTNYHLRIAAVVRDYGMFDREQTPEDSRSRHDADQCY